MKSFIDFRTAKDQTYQILREEILMGDLAPGDKLVEQALADRLQVSRSPVREAIKQLTGDGLVVSPPNKGAWVRRLSLQEVEDYYDVRVMYEVYSARRAPEQITPADRQDLEGMLASLPPVMRSREKREYLRLDFAIHEAIIRLSGNELIRASYPNLYTLLNNALFLGDRELDMATGPHGYQAILRALLEGDAPLLEELLLRHLEESRQMLLSCLGRTPHRKLSPARFLLL